MNHTTHEDEYEGTFRIYTGPHVRAVVQEFDDGSAYLERIDVDEDHQNQGIGTSAIQEILEDYECLYAAPDNSCVVSLYARLGEKIVGDGIDAAAPKECLYYLDQGFGVFIL